LSVIGITAPLAGSTDESLLTRPGTRADLDVVLQGRVLAHLAAEEMVAEIKLRASRHLLDRGLRISLPYFDDRRMALRYWEFTVIPKGRILFVPAFVVLAAEREIARVRADRQFTETTRTQLLSELRLLAAAFSADPQHTRRSA